MVLSKVLWIAPLAVVAYDIIASLASLSFGFPYVYAGIGSAIIYAVAGFLAANSPPATSSVVVGLMMGLADATLGWGISWAIGPGRPSSGSFSLGQWLIGLVSVTVFAIVFASLGSFIASSVQSRSVA